MRTKWLWRLRWTLGLAQRGLRGLAKVSAVLSAVCVCLVFVLWDVEFEKVRERYERFKTAIFAVNSNTASPPGSISTGATFEQREDAGLVFVTGKQPVGSAFE